MRFDDLVEWQQSHQFFLGVYLQAILDSDY